MSQLPKNSDFVAELTWRGLIHQCTDQKFRPSADKPIKAYIGFDPTADSLHVGSLLPVLNLVRLALAGHNPIALVGGATGMIGDPSGKTQERSLLDKEQLAENQKGLTRQLNLLFERAGVKGKVKVVNNYDWFSGLSYLEFLRDVGKHFTVNMMLGKESVRSRLEDRDHGISYTEFSYMLLQAYDFWHLYKHEKCSLQLGGSDQWGNIVAGVDLIRRMTHATGQTDAAESYGITFPLVTKSDGAKFGKSEKGNIWLDPARTSAYDFHQFFLRAEDADVVMFLKYFTFLNSEEIAALEQETKIRPEARTAQKRLADEVTTLVHGATELASVQQAASALFSGDLTKLSAEQLKTTLADAPQSALPRSQLSGEGLAVVDLLVETKLCASKGAARKDIQGGGVYLNNERVVDPSIRVTPSDLVDGELVVLRKGKKSYHLVMFN